MNKPKHTPGPWWNEKNVVVSRAYVCPPTEICRVNSFNPQWPKKVTKQEQEANARLIAAAPELLGACKTVAQDCIMALNGDWDKSDEGFKATLDFLQEVIDKATKSPAELQL